MKMKWRHTASSTFIITCRISLISTKAVRVYHFVCLQHSRWDDSLHINQFSAENQLNTTPSTSSITLPPFNRPTSTAMRCQTFMQPLKHPLAHEPTLSRCLNINYFQLIHVIVLNIPSRQITIHPSIHPTIFQPNWAPTNQTTNFSGSFSTSHFNSSPSVLYFPSSKPSKLLTRQQRLAHPFS